MVFLLKKNLVSPIKVDPTGAKKEEQMGLDLAQHGEEGSHF